jgi:hypothetical protein
MLAKQLIERGELGEIRHYRGTYLQDWITDPKFPLVWRLQKDKAGSGALGDIRRALDRLCAVSRRRESPTSPATSLRSSRRARCRTIPRRRVA